MSKVTPEELEALKCHKGEILRLLTPPPPVLLHLDPTTVREVLGDHPDVHDLGSLRLDILVAVRQLEIEIANGVIDKRVRMVRGRTLADWLSLDDLARLLETGGCRSFR